MSELRVDSVKSKGGGAPDLPKGVTISGITTAVTLGATQIDVSNVNVSGVVTSATLNGELLSTGTPTLGLGVTINSSGVVISGVATAGIVSATTLYGDGSNLTGVGASIAPLFYQPDPYDTGVLLDAGIGITFNQQVKAGSGNVTLSIANAGVAGTVVENFGVGSSVSISENKITINPTADISATQVYHISYPSGAFTNNEGTDYVGTAYTFQARTYSYELWGWGRNGHGELGQNSVTYYSSPVQIPGTTWDGRIGKTDRGPNYILAIKTDGKLWSWGYNARGQLGVNNRTEYSSPVQVGSDTTWSHVGGGKDQSGGIKNDGTLWSWGYNGKGALGDNSTVDKSSPVQIPGTTWSEILSGSEKIMAIKTDGTMWIWGANYHGTLGQNQTSGAYSSPVQIPGTTWSSMAMTSNSAHAIRTDGTMWAWGRNTAGELGQNHTEPRSSPVQIPGTTWSQVTGLYSQALAAIKTDGTLWSWGYNEHGALGQNNRTEYSSPRQIPGTTWSKVIGGNQNFAAIKTDGTLWTWGSGSYGNLGQNTQGASARRSSPVQVGSETDWFNIMGAISTDGSFIATKRI